jgi:AcrR family transcriptional regulator
LTKKTSISRGKLVKSARDLFRHQGYNKTTIDDISAASGLNRGSIYFYFKGKEDLARPLWTTPSSGNSSCSNP